MTTKEIRNMSIPQGIDMFSTSFDGPFGWIPNALPRQDLQRSDDMEGPPCWYCFELLDGLDLDAPLPVSNCYDGQGLGMWVDSYFSPSEEKYWQELKEQGTRFEYLDILRALGVRSFILGSDDPNEFQHIASLATADPTLLRKGEVISGRWELGEPPKQHPDIWIPKYFPGYLDLVMSYYHDEPLENLMLQAIGGDPSAKHDMDKFRLLLDDYLSNLLKFLCDNDEKTTFVFSTYDLSLVKEFVDRIQQIKVPCKPYEGKSMLDLMREGKIRIYPDHYNEADKKSYYRKLQNLYLEHGILTKWIRPFINTSSSLCEYGEKRFDNPPVSLICETIFYQSLGFGSPYLYTPEGWTQDKWDSLFLLSWFLGCIEPDTVAGMVSPGCALNRPTTLRGLLRILCQMFVMKPTKRQEEERKRFLSCFSVYRDHPHPPENPQTCLPCCVNAVGEAVPIDTEHYRALRAKCRKLPKCCRDAQLC